MASCSSPAAEDLERVRRLRLLDADGEVLLRLARRGARGGAGWSRTWSACSCPAKGDVLTPMRILIVGCSTRMRGSARALPARGSGRRSCRRRRRPRCPAMATISPAAASGAGVRFRPSKVESTLTVALSVRPSLMTPTGWFARDRAGDDAPDGEAPDVVVVVDVADEDLQRRRRGRPARGDLVEDHLEERGERRRRVLERQLGDALAADGVDEREVELRVGRPRDRRRGRRSLRAPRPGGRRSGRSC